MDTKFKIIIPCYNCSPWINNCITSVADQTYNKWECIIIDDKSTDITLKKIHQSIPKENKSQFTIINNEENIGALNNIVAGINKLCNDNEDVIILLDGDDWLNGNYVLDLINKKYQNEKIWLTYGQYKNLSNGYPGISTYINSTERYRIKSHWRTSHLRTFKYKLWKNINDSDLRDNNGKYYSMSWDMAIMFPLIEMAGLNRIKYVKDIIYIYNDLNPLNDMKKDRKLQLLIEKEIRSKKQYSEIK